MLGWVPDLCRYTHAQLSRVPSGPISRRRGSGPGPIQRSRRRSAAGLGPISLGLISPASSSDGALAGL
jgi:hypothetical protein